jgi:hypothetical protein
MTDETVETSDPQAPEVVEETPTTPDNPLTTDLTVEPETRKFESDPALKGTLVAASEAVLDGDEGFYFYVNGQPGFLVKAAAESFAKFILNQK